MDTSIDIAPNLASGTASTFTDNNTGGGAAISVSLNEMAMGGAAMAETTLNIIDTTIDNNGTAVDALVTGGAAGLMRELNVTMDGLPSISGNRNDVIDFDTLSGATSMLTFINNANMTMNGTTAGDWLDLNVNSGPSGAVTSMEIMVEDNVLVGIGGAGLRANVTGASTLSGTFEDNMLMTVGSFGAVMTYNTSAATLNTFSIDGNTFDGTGGDAIRLATNGMSSVDFRITRNMIMDPTAADGIDIDANESSMLRVRVEGNELVDNGVSTSRDGIALAVNDNAMLLGRVVGNEVTNFGGNGNTTISVPGPAIADPFWGRGIIATASESGGGADATMAILIEGNEVTGSALEGVGVYTTGGAVMDALVIDNLLTGNDVSSVTSTTPVPDELNKLAGRYDFFSQTSSGGDMLCLSLHGNFATNGYVAGEGPFDLTPPGGGGTGMGTMRLEEGTNNLAVRQVWLQGNDVVPFVPPPAPAVSVATPVIGDVAVPTTQVTYDPATSMCVMNYNAKVTAFETATPPFDTSYPMFP